MLQINGAAHGAVKAYYAVKSKAVANVKKHFGKTKNRSHVQVILPYNEQSITAEKACEYTKKSAAYFDEDYRTLYCAHQPDENCDYYHSHILVNPVNVRTGR